ncbi:hypothetical protein Taro_042621, partial [Colocasia esculenta]|nr:hypothetical protein [Colocasia esculenta]
NNGITYRNHRTPVAQLRCTRCPYHFPFLAGLPRGVPTPVLLAALFWNPSVTGLPSDPEELQVLAVAAAGAALTGRALCMGWAFPLDTGAARLGSLPHNKAGMAPAAAGAAAREPALALAAGDAASTGAPGRNGEGGADDLAGYRLEGPGSYSCEKSMIIFFILSCSVDMDRIPAICTYKGEAYVIHVHRDIELDGIVMDICSRWRLDARKLELKCMIPQSNSSMQIFSGDDMNRMIDMHSMLGSKLMNMEVSIQGVEESMSFRVSVEQSSGSGSNNMLYETSNPSQDSRKRTELWYDIVHSKGQTFNSVEHLRSDLTKFAISRGFDFYYIKNDSTRVTVKCKNVTCTWNLHAIRVGLGPHFEIK